LGLFSLLICRIREEKEEKNLILSYSEGKRQKRKKKGEEGKGEIQTYFQTTIKSWPKERKKKKESCSFLFTVPQSGEKGEKKHHSTLTAV